MDLKHGQYKDYGNDLKAEEESMREKEKAQRAQKREFTMRKNDLNNDYKCVQAQEAELEQEENKLNQCSEENRDRLEKAKNNYMALQESIETLKRGLSDKKMTEIELKDLSNAIVQELLQLKSLHKHLTEKIPQFKEELREIYTGIQVFSNEIRRLNESISKLTIDAEKEKSNVEIQKQLQVRNENEVENLQRERTKLETQISEEEVAVEQIQDYTKESQAKDDKEVTVSREAERQAKRAKIQRLETRFDAVSNRLQSYKDKIDTNIFEICKAEGNQRALEYQITKHKDNITLLERKKTDQESAHREKQKSLEQTSRERSNIDDKMIACREKKRVLEMNLRDIQGELFLLRSKIQNDEMKMIKLNATMEKLYNQRNELSLKLDGTKSQKIDVETKRKQLNQKIAFLDNQLNQLNQLQAQNQTRQKESDSDAHYFSESGNTVKNEIRSINQNAAHLDLNQRIYRDALIPEMSKALGRRAANVIALPNDNLRPI